MVIQISKVDFGTYYEQLFIDALDPLEAQELVMQVDGDPWVDSVPTAITVSVFDGLASSDLVFSILGQEVFRHTPDSDGSAALVTVPIPRLLDENDEDLLVPGTYELVVSQGLNASGSITFEVLNPPIVVPPEPEPDQDPEEVPGSTQPNGTRRWVFQDVMAGGLGSWVMPMNPVEMEPPPMGRELTARSTTASDELGGQFHIFEAAFQPVEWSFSGYCPSKEMRQKLEQFHEIDRRWYLHDHRGRAWKVTMIALELTPRLTQIWNGEYTNEGHDYKATVLVLDPEWKQVQS